MYIYIYIYKHIYIHICIYTNMNMNICIYNTCIIYTDDTHPSKINFETGAKFSLQ